MQLDNDGKMQGVKQNIRLYFTFLREPQHEAECSGTGNEDDVVAFLSGPGNDSSEDKNDLNGTSEQPSKKRRRVFMKEDHETDDEISGSGSNNDNFNSQQQHDNNSFTPKTIVTYKIDYSIDHGEMKPLLGVDVYALGEYPSVEEAIPMMDDEQDESEEILDTGEQGEHNGVSTEEKDNRKQSTSAEFEDIIMSEDDENNSHTDENNGNGDRFGVYINPENVVSFLDRANMNLNEQSVFYLLLTFPFYEHEWDIAGFLLSALDDEDDEEDDKYEDEDSEANGKGNYCSDDQPCCLPCK